MTNIFKISIAIVLCLSCFINPFFITLHAADAGRVVTVDFLSRYNLTVNGAGPLLVTTDIPRNRIILVNTNTSSISMIDGKTHAVVNIPIQGRVPQYLKSSALAVHAGTGDIYAIGRRSLHVVSPDKKNSVTIDTGEQYAMIAVDETTGAAFLTGRESKFLAMVQPKTKKVKRIPWLDTTDRMKNLNATPPPPIRKVFCDAKLRRTIALDGGGAVGALYIFSAKTGKLLKQRKLNVAGGARWHTAGYNPDTHCLYMVIETDKRKVMEAVKIDVVNGNDTVVKLPGLSEAVGVCYNPDRDEIYIPYDNHPTIHVVDFKPLKQGETQRVTEIKIPTYGNDAGALDLKNQRLYVASWGYGDVEVIDLKTRKMIKRIAGVGVIPHMFNMTFNPNSGELIIPIGATAVNGSFGASLTVLDPESEKTGKIYTGWAPTDLVELAEDKGFMVFNSEDEAAVVAPDGKITYYPLPCRFINRALKMPDGTINLAYGPHQSYWPTVYIWAAKNGILGIDPDTMTFYDRRIPRMAQQMTLDKNGALYALQNNWGGEKQFLAMLPDAVRIPNLGNQRLELDDKVARETTQRILEYDPQNHRLYIVRVGETDDEPGLLQIYDIDTKKILLKYPTGLTPTGLMFDETSLYITNFDSGTIAVVSKDDFSVRKIKTGKKPFKPALLKGALYCINHNGRSLQRFGKEAETFTLPFRPGQLFSTGDRLIITGHTVEAFFVFSFDPASGKLTQLHKAEYPYGETTVDTNNSAFYVRGQFGDGIFELNRIAQDSKGRLWITDYLSGKMMIIARDK